MPVQPSHHVSSFIFRISGLFRISIFGSVGAYYAKQTQSQPGQQPLFTKQTQSPPISSQPRWPKVSLEFIPARRGCTSGNPISLYGHGMPCPKNAKQTQFQHTRCPTTPSAPQKMQNKPNPGTHAGRRSVPTCRGTQFPARRTKLRTKDYMLKTDFNETNPIYELPTTNYQLFMRNKPNFQPPIYILQSTIYNPKACFSLTKRVRAVQNDY